ncbi:MAG: AMP-binding protein [Bacteroidota bacterium]
MYTHNLLLSFKENTAVITDEGKSIKYGDINDFSRLIFSKIGHRCLIFCLCQNHLESLCGYVSFISNRVVPLMLDATLDKELLDDLIEAYKPEYLWFPKYRLPEFSQYQVIFTADEYVLIKLEFNKIYSMHKDLALLLTTSGSTGSPKLVRLTYENIEANARSIAEYLSIKDTDRPITTMPMNYSFGLSIINSHFLVGATVLLTSRTLMEKEFWSFLKKEKATTMSGVPYTYEILKKLRFFQMELPSIEYMTQAGGKLNPDLNKEFAEWASKSNKRFYVMYGQTEATARMSYLPHEFALSKLGSMGWAIPGGEFSIIDDHNEPVTGFEIVGELVYKGRNVSHGYAECGDDLIKEDENKGILITGDLTKRDSDNFYYIVGRKKRFIKLFGNRVNLDETERLLKNIIPDCACIGEDDNMVVYINDYSREQEVREYLSMKTGINIKGFSIRHIDKIPKNSSGKTIYSGLSIR